MDGADTNSGGGDKLFLRHYTQENSSVIEAVGAVSMDTADALAGALHQALEGSPPALTVDLRAVSFLDSSGLRLLVEASRRRRSPQTPRAPRVLVTPGGQPEHVLRLGHFTQILEIVPTA